MEATTLSPSLLDRVEEIAPLIREHANQAEEERRLSGPVVDAMKHAGLYNMARPERLGGLELDPVSMFRVVEEVSRHDSAAGWNLQLSVAMHWFPAWLPDKGANELLADMPDAILGTSFTPGGSAIPVDGGYKVSGQWPFVSGSNDCDWFMFAPFIMDGDEIQVDEQGNPMRLFSLMPARKTTILDTWNTLGMRGTGSHDVLVEEIFVPKHLTALMAPIEQAGQAYLGPLYRMTVWPPIALLAPPALGAARAAIDDFIELARNKTPANTALALKKRQVVQRQVAEAEAVLNAGRAYLYSTFQEVWEAVVSGKEVEMNQKLQMQLATSYATASAARSVDIVHAAVGASGIRNIYQFQRYFRDIHTMTQHAFSSTMRYESVGAIMLGEESDWGFFPF